MNIVWKILRCLGWGLLYIVLGVVLSGLVRKDPVNLDAPITYGELAPILVMIVWVWACFRVGRMAKRRGRSRAGWTWGSFFFTPILMSILLLLADRFTFIAGAPRGVIGVKSAPAGGTEGRSDQSRQHRGGFRLGNQTINKTALRLIIAVVAVLVTGAVWWWIRPTPETFTQQLWRECQETFASTHPEWDEARLSRMTRGCVDQRLLLSPRR